MRRRAYRGLSLGTVLMLSTVALVAALSLAGMTQSHLSFAQRYANNRDALYLAEAAIAEALGQLHQNPEWREGVRLGSGDRRAILSFDPNEADEVPTSSNDFNSEGTGGTAHLIARAQCRGAEKTVEVLVTIPPFLYAVATAGPLVSTDGMEVMGLEEGDPGNIASNVKVNVDGPSIVSGDVISRGEIVMPEARIDGIRKANADLVDLPDLDDEWDPRLIEELKDRARPLKDSYVRGDLTVWDARYTSREVGQGRLEIDGNLRLDDGLLYVDGDLVVNGRVTGKGALVVKGNAQLKGRVDVQAVDTGKSQIAMLADGDVSLTSHSREDNFFQGLVYTRGNFLAEKVRITGAFVLAPPEGSETPVSDRRMQLDDAVVVYDPGATKATVTVADPSLSGNDLLNLGANVGIEGTDWPGPGYSGGWSSDGVKALWLENRSRMVAAIEEAYQGTPFHPFEYWYGCVTGDRAALDLADWAEKLDHPSVNNGNVTNWIRDVREGRRPPHGVELNVTVKGEDGQLPVAFDPTTNRFKLVTGRPVGLTIHLVDTNDHDRGWIPLSTESADAIGRIYLGQDICDDMAETAMNSARRLVDEANAILDEYGPPSGGASSAPFTRELDLNQFLQDSRPLRVLMWRERQP
ncbi:MAG: hypothetical protein HY319_14015 [Armatimonadetes bacterium]|nr:hypothetical protein [Armatimonadota bacterium]